MKQGKFQVMARQVGEQGPWLTLLHGFPTSSADFHKILPGLSQNRRVLVFDFLGFGDSDKPTEYAYNTFERADLVGALWRHFKIEQTDLLAHDMGDTVALELLARMKQAKLTTKISKVIFMNGGLFSDLHQPTRMQKILLNPYFGKLGTYFINRSTFQKQFSAILTQKLTQNELDQIWAAVAARRGVGNYHQLIHYITDRKVNKARWEPLAADPGVPSKYIWGMNDPIAGSSMIKQVKALNPKADVFEIENCGHYPQLEAPGLVLQSALDFLQQ